MSIKKQLVVKDVALINASYRLDLAEQRLILMSTIRARESGTGITADKPLVIYAEDYADQFKVTRQTAYKVLKDASGGLFERQFTYNQITKKGNLEVVKSRWVSRISYIENSGSVSITFAPDVVPLITQLEKRFTSYDLEQISGLTSSYAVRLYELIIAWRTTFKTPEIDLAELRSRLGVPEDEYIRMHHFKARVLDLAIKQINEYTDIKTEYEQHKRGRSISGFSFKFQFKNPDRDTKTIDMFSGKTDEEKRPKRKKITKQQAEAMAKPGEEWQELLARIGKDYQVIF